MAGNLPDQLGPTLCGMAGIEPGGNAEDIRNRLIGFLGDLAAGLPEDLRTAFAAALALPEDVRFRFLDERMQWLACWLQRDVRTARRRTDEAIRLIDATADVPAGYAGDYKDWHLARLCTRLLLDRAAPIAIEERTVVASRDDLAEVSIATSIPVPRDAHTKEQAAELAVLHGGTLVASTWPTATYLRYTIRLPEPLRCGQSHEFGISITTPRGQPFNPRYAIQPLRRCDEFDLRIRFGARQERRVWRIAGLPRGMVDDFADPDALVGPDAAGDIHVRYQHLKLGMVYGARWSAPALLPASSPGPCSPLPPAMRHSAPRSVTSLLGQQAPRVAPSTLEMAVQGSTDDLELPPGRKARPDGTVTGGVECRVKAQLLMA